MPGIGTDEVVPPVIEPRPLQGTEKPDLVGDEQFLLRGEVRSGLSLDHFTSKTTELRSES